MERLTTLYEYSDGYRSKCAETCGECDGCWGLDEIVNRLGAYEDTGLTPAEIHSLLGEWNAMMLVLNSIGGYERLRQLAEADKAGRAVILPCKVGDTVWTNIAVSGDRYRLSDRPHPVKVVFFGNGGEKRFFHVEYSSGTVFPFDESAIGKRVFLTREEAEKTLKEARR